MQNHSKTSGETRFSIGFLKNFNDALCFAASQLAPLEDR
jgi:hypothetical protein